MPYTAEQLVAAYTAATDGVVPNASTVATLTSYANQNAAGQLTDTAALGNVVNMADPTTAVAVQAYQFFTGKSPSKGGLDFLVNSATNTTDLNDPYYAAFNIENRYINFAANLALQGDGAVSFIIRYAGLSFSAFVASAYETIIGSSYAAAAGINVTAALADIGSRQAAFTQTARERQLINANSTPAQVDIATKAAVIGYLLVEGIKADVGLYAAGSNNFVLSLINGTPQYNVDILTTYSPLGGGIGTPVPAGGLPTVLLSTTDVFPGTAGNDVISGVIFSDSPATTTFNVADIINGAGGQDTLNLTVSKAAGGATGAVAVPTTTLTSIETVNIRSLSTTAADVTSVNAASFTSTSAVNSDRSLNALAITNLAAGAAAGLIGDGTTVLGNLSFGYAIPGSAAALNLSGGVRNAPTVTITTPAASATITSTGPAANTVGAIALGGAATSLTILANSSFNTSGVTGFGASATITVSGQALGAIPSLTVLGAPAVTLGALDANVATVNASGLANGGIGATIGANPALNFNGGAGIDRLVVAAGTGAALTGAINGGGGIDSVTFSTGADLTATSGARFTSFETAAFVNNGAVGTLQSFTPGNIAGLTTIQVNDSIGSVQLQGLAAGATVVATAVFSGTNAAGALSLQLANASGGSDALTLQLNNSLAFPGVLSGSGANIDGLALGGSGVAGQVETLNIVSGGAIAPTGDVNRIFLQASGTGPNFADPNTITVTGDQPLDIITGVLGHALTVNASGMTGNGAALYFDSSAGGAFAVNVTGTAKNDDMLFGANQTGTYTGGGGGDRITLAAGQQVVAYTAQADSKFDVFGAPGSSGNGTSNVGGMDFILGFTSGTDKLSVSALGTGLAGAIIADKGTTATTTAVTALLNTATLFQDGGGVARKVAQFDYTSGAGGTFLVLDTNSNGTYEANDVVIFIGSGVLNIASGDLI